MQEKWAFIPIEGLSKDYQISTFGNIRRLDYDNISLTKNLSQSESDKRGMQINFRIDGENKSFDVHRIMLLTFKGFTPNKVKHLDGNKKNNMLSNLVDESFDYKQAQVDLKSLSMQNWVDIPGHEGLYQVSDKGMVRSIKYYRDLEDRKIRYLKLSEMENRTYVRLRNKKSLQTKCGVNRLVAAGFLGLDLKDKYTIVTHKDKNPHNNCVDNLVIKKINKKKKLFGLF